MPDISSAVSFGHLGCSAAVQLWRLQEWVQQKVDARLALLEQAVKPTIGFHIRGGDKGEEDVLRVKMLRVACHTRPVTHALSLVH